MNRQSTYLTKLRGKKRKLKWRWFVLSLIRYQSICFLFQRLSACLPAYLRGSFYAVLVLLLARVLGGAVFGPLPPSLPSPPPRHPSRSLVPPRNPFATEKDPAFINFGTHSNKRLVSSHNASLLLPFQITSIHIRMINVCWFHFSKLNIYHPYMYGCDLKVTYC
jgi:hypothetical protein